MHSKTQQPDAPGLMDDLQAVIWEADPVTFRFQYVSRGAEVLLGYPLHYWLERPTFWVDLLHPDDREHAVRECLAAVAECRDHDFEYRVITRAGEVLWLRDIVSVICEEGRPVTLRGLMVNVTHCKADEAARGSEERYRRVALDHSCDIVTIVDEKGVIQYSSPSVMRVLGYPADQRSGRDLSDFVHPDDRRRVRVVLQAVFAGGSVPPFVHLRYRHANGSWLMLEATGQRLDRKSV